MGPGEGRVYRELSNIIDVSWPQDGNCYHFIWFLYGSLTVLEHSSFSMWVLRFCSSMASLCLAVNFNLEREVFPHVIVPNRGSAGVVIKAMIKRSQVECELAFISAPAARASSWSCWQRNLRRQKSLQITGGGSQVREQSSAGDGQGITLLGVPPIDLRHWSCSKNPEGSLLLPLLWRMVSVERLPRI